MAIRFNIDIKKDYCEYIKIMISIINYNLLILNYYNCFYNIFFRLALYVYEYLLHIGAQKAAQTFLNEVSIYFKYIYYCNLFL